MNNKQQPERISGSQLWNNFKDAYDIEKGWIYTFRELTLRPGQVLKEYVEGDRRMVNPIKYALMSITITVIAQLIENLIYPSSEVFGPGSLEDRIGDYIFPLLAVLCFSGVLYLLNLKKGFNFFEYFIVFIYSFSHAMLLTAILWDILLAQLYHLFGIKNFSIINEITGTVILVLILLYMFWVIKVFLNIKFWRSLLNASVILVVLVLVMNFMFMAMDRIFINEHTDIGLTIVESQPQIGWFDVIDKVEVETIDPLGPSSKAGIHTGDIILKINGEIVYSDTFYESIFRYDPGETVVMTIERNGKELDYAIHLSSRKITE
jgi:hypothetical protein